MLTHRFGRKLKLPATMAIKHQIRTLMFDDLPLHPSSGRGKGPLAMLTPASAVPLKRPALPTSMRFGLV